MKVAHIAVYPESGRTHSSSHDLSALAGYLKALLGSMPENERGDHLVLTNLKSGNRRNFSDSGMKVEECWQKGSPLFCLQILGALRRHQQAGIVHLQHEFNQFGRAFTLPLIVALVGAIRFVLRRFVVITFHEVLEQPRITKEFLKSACIGAPVWVVKSFLRVYYRMLCGMAHAIVVQDEAFAEMLMRDYGVPAAKLHIVRIGTGETSALAERALSRTTLGLDPDWPVLLFFGTIDRHKGLDLLLQALRLMGDSAPVLLMAGGSPVRVRDTPDYKAWRTALDATMQAMPNVRCIGFVEDHLVPSLYAACDLALLMHTEPQRVSAVFSQCATHEVPFLVSPAFADQSEPIQVVAPEPGAIAAKIKWALQPENKEALRDASRRFKASNSWSASYNVLRTIYASFGN